MKQLVTFLFIIGILNSSYSQTYSWATKKSLGDDLIARQKASMVSYNNKLYILGGYNSSGPQDFTEYDPATKSLRKLKSVASGTANPLSGKCLYQVKGKLYYFDGNGYRVYDFVQDSWTYKSGSAANLVPDGGFVINDTIYLVSQIGNYFYSYNVATDKFTKRADFPGSASRTNSISFTINAKGYTGAGQVGSTFLSSFYEYDPTNNTWATKASLPISFAGGIGIGYNNKGYAGLGTGFINTTPADIRDLQYWYEYNPTNNTWTKKQNFLSYADNSKIGLAHSCIAIVNASIYTFGGGNPGGVGGVQYYLDDIFKYDITNDNWATDNADPGQNRTQAAGFYVNGKIYIGGGNDSEALNDFWEYTISTDTWAKKKSFSTYHYSRACVELGGKGYFLGGYLNSSLPSAVIDSLLEYNPASDSWTKKAAFPGGPRSGLAAFAYNGSIYAGLGFNTQQSPSLYNDFYKYNPTTNTWSSLASTSGFNSSVFSSFVIGDTAYVVTFGSGNNIFKYSFLSNTWKSEAHSLSNPGNSFTNMGFAYNNLGYVVTGGGTGHQLWKYTPATGTWQTVLNMPFINVGQNVLATPNGIYFAFGYTTSNVLGILNQNDLKELKFDYSVSKTVGSFNSFTNNGWLDPANCGTGSLTENTANTIYDSDGKVFVSMINKTKTTIASTCVEVISRDTLLPYREMNGKFGNSYNEHAMFLNKSVHTSTGIDPNLTLRNYYTTSELTKLVNAFNAKYGTSKTINDIKIFQYYDYSLNDKNPLNNNAATALYFTNTPTFNAYGADKYVEIQNTSNSLVGEIYAILTFAAPAAPVANAATIHSSTSFTANWSAVANALGYRLDVSTDNFNTFLPGYNNLLVSGTSQVITGLTEYTNYQYRVRAVGLEDLASNNSNVINAQTKSTQQINFSAIEDKIYGVAPFSLPGYSSKGLPITYVSSNLSVATVSGNIVTIVGAGTTVFTATQAGDANYDPATAVTQNLLVNKRDQSIAFGGPLPKIFGDADFNLTATASSSLDVTYTSSNLAVATISGNKVTIVGAGQTVITANQAGNTNYNAATSTQQTLVVNKATQTITFGALQSKEMGDADFALTAEASSGLNVNYTSSNQSVAKVTGNTVTIVGVGTTTITASQTGNSNYLAASSVTQDLVVTVATSIVKGSNEAFTIYPNPVEGRIIIHTPSSLKTSNLSIIIFNANGVSVYRNVTTNGDTEIDASNFASGMYSVVIEGDGFKEVQRIAVK